MKIDILKLLRQIHSGDDGQPSGKRVWGSVFFGGAIIMGFIALFKYPDRFDTFALFVTPFITAGLTLWGIAAWQTQNSKKIDSDAANPDPAPINIGKVDTVTSTTNTTKADTATIGSAETVNSQNTTINQ